MLDQPIDLAGRTAPSRVLFGPHETNLARGRALSDRHVAYYRRRAAGGAGAIVTEVASVHSSDWPYERAPLAADSASGWRSVVRACRPHGTLVLAGLGHAGSQGSSAFSQRPLWAPSRVADVVSRELPMRMERPEIQDVLDGFASSATLAVESDVDGVELNAGQHSLLRQFLSGLTNTRTDSYGEDRTLFLREVLTAVREAVHGRILGLRLCCDELAPWAGITSEDASVTAAALASDVDYLVVVRGSAMSTSATRPDSHTAAGFNAALCREIRAAVDRKVPVVLQGSVVDPDQARWAIDDGVADLVEMTRAQIADPDLVRKLGEPEHRIRPCTLTNQKCQVRDNRNPIVSCLAEPDSGHETTDPEVIDPDVTDPGVTDMGVPDLGTASTVTPLRAGSLGASFARNSQPDPVLVVGGGPAGLEAARVLAMRGHGVCLVERDAQLGGMLARAALLPARDGLRRLSDWLAAEILRLGVEVTTATEVTDPDQDLLVLATGSKRGPRDYVTHPGAAVVDVVDLLRSEALPPGPVVVHDPVGDAVGVGVAELLAGAGRATTIVTPDPVVGTQLAITGDLADANGRLQRAGTRLAKRHKLREVRADHVTVTDVFTGVATEIECATLIHCGHRVPDDRLSAPHGVEVGDRVAPRTAHEAVLEGRRAALELSRGPEAVPR